MLQTVSQPSSFHSLFAAGLADAIVLASVVVHYVHKPDGSTEGVHIRPSSLSPTKIVALVVLGLCTFRQEDMTPLSVKNYFTKLIHEYATSPRSFELNEQGQCVSIH